MNLTEMSRSGAVAAGGDHTGIAPSATRIVSIDSGMIYPRNGAPRVGCLAESSVGERDCPDRPAARERAHEGRR
jgi:hypothetical protein